MTGPENAVELNWDAFRYIADEMDAEERNVFEEQLAESQHAREAVAEVVELSQSVALAVKSVPAVPAEAPRSRLAPFAWMSVGAALCLAVMLTLRPAADGPTVAVKPQTTPELAEHWLTSSHVAGSDESDWRAPPPADRFDADSPVVSDTESEIPNWLMAAVSVRSDQAPRNEN